MVQKKVIFNNESIYQNGMTIKENCRKLIVSMNEFSGADYKGIEQWNIREFLMKFE